MCLTHSPLTMLPLADGGIWEKSKIRAWDLCCSRPWTSCIPWGARESWRESMTHLLHDTFCSWFWFDFSYICSSKPTAVCAVAGFKWEVRKKSKRANEISNHKLNSILIRFNLVVMTCRSIESRCSLERPEWEAHECPAKWSNSKMSELFVFNFPTSLPSSLSRHGISHLAFSFVVQFPHIASPRSLSRAQIKLSRERN